MTSILEIPDDTPLSKINLPCEWHMYLYNKYEFKKVIKNKTNYEKPYETCCYLKTINDLIFLLNLMEIKIEENKCNLDLNNIVIMRKGINPIWEDPKNKNGGTFTIKIPCCYGYLLWSKFVMYIIGETLNEKCELINGISVSYIHNDDKNNIMTYIKIWDAQENNTLDNFVKNLPDDIVELLKIRKTTTFYIKNNTKRDYKNDKINMKTVSKKSFSNRNINPRFSKINRAN